MTLETRTYLDNPAAGSGSHYGSRQGDVDDLHTAFSKKRPSLRLTHRQPALPSESPVAYITAGSHFDASRKVLHEPYQNLYELRFPPYIRDFQAGKEAACLGT